MFLAVDYEYGAIIRPLFIQKLYFYKFSDNNGNSVYAYSFYESEVRILF